MSREGGREGEREGRGGGEREHWLREGKSEDLPYVCIYTYVEGEGNVYKWGVV